MTNQNNHTNHIANEPIQVTEENGFKFYRLHAPPYTDWCKLDYHCVKKMNPSESNDATITNKPEKQPSAEQEREKNMAELLMTMDDYNPIIPDAVIDHYLNKTGFDCDDPRIKKLFALAAQKFVADIATDAYQHNQVKQSGSRATGKNTKDRKAVLTMEDLSTSLAEYGVNVKKPDYY